MAMESLVACPSLIVSQNSDDFFYGDEYEFSGLFYRMADDALYHDENTLIGFFGDRLQK